MAYDEELADRIRALLGGDPLVTETRMFGGLAFLVNGHLAVAASRQGGLLVRVDPDDSARLTRSASVEHAVMRGRVAEGWVRVAADGVRTARQLATWVERGVSCARSLPPKPRKR